MNETMFALIFIGIYIYKNPTQDLCHKQQEHPGSRRIINSAHHCFCHSQCRSGDCQLSLWHAAGKCI